MQGNIVAVLVNGTEVSRDRDMTDENVFDVVTSRNNRYRVVRDLESWRKFAWNVMQISESGAEVSITVGRVTGVRSLFARKPTLFSYVSTHDLLDSGNQNDFLNAIQSLTD